MKDIVEENSWKIDQIEDMKNREQIKKIRRLLQEAQYPTNGNWEREKIDAREEEIIKEMVWKDLPRMKIMSIGW